MIAGENYTLACTIIVVEGLVDDALITTAWTDSRRNPLPSDIMQTSSTNTTSMLEFNPLFTSHGGRYTCDAFITISTISIQKRNLEVYDIIVQSNAVVIN